MATLQEQKKNLLLFFFISPILGLIYGLRTKRSDAIRWSIFVFVFIYGSLLHPSHMGDGATHINNMLAHYPNLSFSQFWNELINILSFNPSYGTNDDPYLHILSYFVSSVLNSPNLLFVGVALVFAYFYSGAIVFLMSYVNWKSQYNKFYFTFFLILFLFWQNPGNMQSIRVGTAIWIVIYGIIGYHKTKKIKYVFLIFLSPFFHFAFLLLVLPFCIVLFSGYRNPRVYFIIFLISVFSANIVDSSALNNLVSQTEIGASKVKSYTLDEERIENIKQNNLELAKTSRFYKVYQTDKIHYNLLTGLIIFMFFFLRKKGFNQIENTLFSYGLAGTSFANFLAFNYAVYNRLWVISGIFILSLFVIFLSKQKLRTRSISFLKIQLPMFIFVVGFIPYLFFLVSAFLNFTSLYVLFMPIVMWIEYDMGISIRGFIGFFM
jgi:hypothetical protein